MTTSDPSKLFAGKFLEKLDKIGLEDIEAFLSKLLKEKTFFEAVINHLLEGCVVLDPERRVLFVNRSARKLLGLGQKRIIGLPLLEQIEPGELRETLVQYDPVHDKIQLREASYVRGAERLYGLTLIPVRDESDVLIAIVALIQDRTEQRRKEERRIQSERMESLATLTSGVAHEIKNPLNSLSIHAHLAQKSIARFKLQQQPKELERAGESAGVLVEEVERLSRIVDEFLQAARPTKPQFSIKNVNDVLRRLIDLMSAEAADRKIDVKIELDNEIPATRIDEFQLGLAFRNIVKNSMEAIDHKGGKIHIQSELEPEEILIEFRDDGRGIPGDKIRRIFEPYVTTKFSGTGLGLMTVHRIVNEHSGVIAVESKEGQGTLFRITLPLKPGPRGLLPDKPAETSNGERDES